MDRKEEKTMNKSEEISINKYDLLYEQRMTRVETVLESLATNVKILSSEVMEIRKEMKSDFRWILGMMVALFGLMAHGFHWF
jgi:G3E family GTPase